MSDVIRFAVRHDHLKAGAKAALSVGFTGDSVADALQRDAEHGESWDDGRGWLFSTVTTCVDANDAAIVIAPLYPRGVQTPDPSRGEARLNEEAQR